jgi:glycosyltransferase 2 family protein
MRANLLRILQVLVTLGVLVWVFHDRQMRANIPILVRRADPRWLLLGAAFAGAGELANIFRWQIFLRMQKVRIPIVRTAMVFMIGVFFSLFLLGVIGGDVIRAAYLCADQDDKKPGVIMSVIADRLIGMLVMVPFAFIIVLFRYRWFQKTPAASAMFWFLVIFMIVVTIFLVFAIVITRLGLAEKLPAWVRRRGSLMRTIKACGLFGRSGRDFALAYGLSIPVLFGMFVAFYCAGRAFSAHVSLVDVFSIMPIVTVITSLPISVSGIGVREQLFKNLLGDLTGTPAEVAVLISLAGFLSYVCWSLVGAVIWLISKPARGK